jgi:RecA-family ATPase
VASIARTHKRNHPESEDPDTPLFDLDEARIARFLDVDPPPRRWLLHDCLPLGKVGLLVAPGGTGKSQLALQLAIAVASGGHLAGYWKVGEKGRVLGLFAEEDDEELHRRLRAVLRGLAAGADQTSAVESDLRENLLLKSLSGEDSLMTCADASGSVTRTNFSERLCDLVKQLGDFKLIIIDPVSRFRGGNENFAEDATRFVEAAEFIARETGATVLLLHHANKASSSGEDQHQGASRGSSALTDGVRWQMNLAALTDKQAKVLALENAVRHEYLAAKVTKNNYGPSGETVFLHRETHGVLAFHNQQETQRTSELERLKLLVATIREQAAAGKPYSKSSFSKAYGSPEGLFKLGVNALDALIARAVEQGYLTLSSGRARHLVSTDKPIGIVKAKLPGGGYAHGGS